MSSELTSAEAAEILGCCKSHITLLIKRHQLIAASGGTKGHAYRFRREDVMACWNQLEYKRIAAESAKREAERAKEQRRIEREQARQASRAEKSKPTTAPLTGRYKAIPREVSIWLQSMDRTTLAPTVPGRG